MSWIALVFSGLMESVWAIALDKSNGFTNVAPTLVFIIGMVLSMLGLGYAVKTIPLSIAYAVWVGIGVVSTSVYSTATGAEPVSLARILLLCGLVGCIAGLKLTSE